MTSWDDFWSYWSGIFLIIAVAVGRRVATENANLYHIESLISKLIEIGIQMDISKDCITVYGKKRNLKPIDVVIQIYPGFATDLQQPLIILLT